MNALTITGVAIRQDEQGRYCLNDLHKASGGHSNHRPSKWLRYDQAKALIEEIDRETPQPESPILGFGANQLEALIRASNSVRGHGITATYVVKELVYAYAMWISPAFNLRVIRAYDALVTGELQALARVENYWAQRRSHWPLIRPRVLAGETYRSIAEAIGLKPPQVSRAVRSMCFTGVLNPLKVAEVQRGPARRAALRYAEQLGLLKPAGQPAQLSLWEVQW